MSAEGLSGDLGQGIGMWEKVGARDRLWLGSTYLEGSRPAAQRDTEAGYLPAAVPGCSKWLPAPSVSLSAPCVGEWRGERRKRLFSLWELQ